MHHRQTDNGGKVNAQAHQGDRFAAFNIRNRTADHLTKRHAKHKKAQALLNAVDVRTQRLRHFGNRRQIGIDRKRHQRDQHRHQHGHGFFAQRGLLCSHSDFRFRKKYSKNKENNRLVRRLRIGWNYSRFQPCPITAKKPLQNLRPSETLLG